MTDHRPSNHQCDHIWDMRQWMAAQNKAPCPYCEIDRLIMRVVSLEREALNHINQQPQIERLRAALERYGKHEASCLAVYGADGDQCSCGFAQFCPMCLGKAAPQVETKAEPHS